MRLPAATRERSGYTALPLDEPAPQVSDMDPATQAGHEKDDAPVQVHTLSRESEQSAPDEQNVQESQNQHAPVQYRVYKRRWFGLIQLVLLNIVVSWDWLTYSPIVNTTADFFNTTPAIVNWLSTAFLFAFVAAAPFSLWALHSRGPKTSIVAAASLLLVGNWIRYGGVRASPNPSYGAVMVGQIIIGLAQPFVLAAPTAYSDLWFSPRGRVSATALASLANPFGGALGQLIDPFLASKPADVAPLTLYVAIISSVAAIPAFFIPAAPPTPAAPNSAGAVERAPIAQQARQLARNQSFWLLAVPFFIFVGFFNSLSSLLAQVLTPYNFSEDDAGIAGAILIVVGLVAAAISSPLVDRYKPYLLLVRLLIPVLAVSYLVFIWCPPSRTIVAPYVVCAFLGGASFILVPVALEWAVEITYPVGPELTSVLMWSGGQLLGGIFIEISEALMAGPKADPPANMQRALIFQAVLSMLAAPCAFALGFFGSVENRRLAADREARERETHGTS